ncbi:MAG: RdgB/HAM1 family non-canonical purine NTP pyrophosphatase [Clostridiales bacterium]|nr:RdgB/HAM1 family non-canonical purine NTP pyrophosphatase [Candidatus Crickella caballi]
MGRVILASQNKDKIREIDAIFRKYDMPVVSRDEAGLPKDEIEETGQTFEENSLIKALGIRAMIEADESLSEHLDSIIVADDTGLMVDALNGAPGVYSARYAGEDCRYEDNCRKLLEELKGVPYEDRTAHFETVITLLYPDGTKLVAVGQCKGHIGLEPKGDAGFGYDPLFVPEGYDKTFAELGTDIKNTISHRANALAELERLLG